MGKVIQSVLRSNELLTSRSRIEVPDAMDDAALPVARYIPRNPTENTYLFSRALGKEGLVEPWHEAINPSLRLPLAELSPEV